MEQEVKVRENIQEQPKRVRKAGRVTFGITMILFGISIILQTVVSFDILRYVLMFWPVILISLGIEVITYNSKKDVVLKYDVAGIIMIFIILFFGTIFSFVNYGVNKVLYNKDIQEVAIEHRLPTVESYPYEGNTSLHVNNLTSNNVKVKIVEVKNYSNTYVTVKLDYDKEKIDNWISILSDEYSMNKMINAYNNNQEFTIINFPSWLNSITLEISTGNKDNIKFNGNFTVE